MTLPNALKHNSLAYQISWCLLCPGDGPCHHSPAALPAAPDARCGGALLHGEFSLVFFFNCTLPFCLCHAVFLAGRFSLFDTSYRHVQLKGKRNNRKCLSKVLGHHAPLRHPAVDKSQVCSASLWNHTVFFQIMVNLCLDDGIGECCLTRPSEVSHRDHSNQDTNVSP